MNKNICYFPNTIEQVVLSSDNRDCINKIKKIFKHQNKSGWICPVLLHTFVPYYLTLKKGGKFTWMRNKNKVIVQCPRSDSPCVIELGRISSSGSQIKIQARILAVDSTCSVKLKKNQTFLLDDIFNNEGCVLGFDNVFPLVECLRGDAYNNILLSCNCDKEKALIKLDKNRQAG